MTWKKVENDGEFSRSWDFSVDKVLDGIYVSSKNAQSKRGKPIKFHTFKVGEEEVSVLGGVVLDRNIEALEKGQRVMIEFLGEKQGKNGPYKNYEFNLWEE